jgi:hypothetical protein
MNESEMINRKSIIAKTVLYRSIQSEETDVETKIRCSCEEISSWLPCFGLVRVHLAPLKAKPNYIFIHLIPRTIIHKDGCARSRMAKIE